MKRGRIWPDIVFIGGVIILLIFFIEVLQMALEHQLPGVANSQANYSAFWVTFWATILAGLVLAIPVAFVVYWVARATRAMIPTARERIEQEAGGQQSQARTDKDERNHER